MSESGRPGHGGEFFTLLEALRVFRAGSLAGDPSDRALAKAAGVSPTTIGDWLHGRRFPQDIGKVLVMVRMVRTAAVRRGVAILGTGPAGLLDEGRWRAAYQQEARRRAGVVSGGVEQAQAAWALAGPRVRVREADLRRLGVHQAINVPGVADGVLPEYVPRDVDGAGNGVRAKVAVAAERGGFVLLVGGSSVGKTRCAAEALRALLPDWWLGHPAGSAEVAALAAAPPSRTVVWLDELQRYLGGEHGLDGGVVRALLGAPHPVVIIGTLWPDLYSAWTAARAVGGADPHPREREVLGLADVVRVAPVFSPAEQDRARAAAGRDPQLRAALNTAGYGLTQTLAAAPQLVARWEDTQTASPYTWAVLTAALDAARLGTRAPLGADFLRTAAPGYCTSQQQAEAPGNWFEQALAYATGKLHGAAAPLSPTGVGMSKVAGYIPADYLIQHASRERRYARVPASTWDALLSHVHDPADTARLADSSRDRLLYSYAIPLYCHAADAGDGFAAVRLAVLLEERGDLDGLRARADAGDRSAVLRLAYLLEKRGDLDGAAQALRARADAGDGDVAVRLSGRLEQRGDLDGAVQVLRARAGAGDRDAAARLAGLLGKRGDLDGLRGRADAGDGFAAELLAVLLEERGDLDGLRARAGAGDRDAAARLAGLLGKRGDLDGLRGRADAGDGFAAELLAVLLEERGDLDGLRARAGAGDRDAAARLAGLLGKRGDLDGLRGRADAGDGFAAELLAVLLEERGDLDGLRARAGAGDRDAAARLAGLLEQRGDLDGAARVLRARADAGDRDAAARLAGLLGKRGDLDGLRARADAGDGFAAELLAVLLEERGDLDGLRARAGAGDRDAAARLAGLLGKRQDLDGLRGLADAGDGFAAVRLAGLLQERGDLDGAARVLRTLADAGHRDAAARLAPLLEQRGDLDGAARVLRTLADAGHRGAAVLLAALHEKRQDLDGLRALADAGDGYAARRLAGLLGERGDLAGLRALADAGDGYAAVRLAGLLEQRGDLDGAARVLRTLADAGDRDAAARLAPLLIKQGRGEEAERLRRFGLNPDGSIACA